MTVVTLSPTRAVSRRHDGEPAGMSRPAHLHLRLSPVAGWLRRNCS